jgi:hypothetical protein
MTKHINESVEVETSNLKQYREDNLDNLKFWSFLLLPAAFLWYVSAMDSKPILRNQQPVVEIKGTFMSSYGFDFGRDGSLDSAVTWATTGRGSGTITIPKDHNEFKRLQSIYSSKNNYSDRKSK